MTNASQDKPTLTTHGKGSRTHIPDYAPILFTFQKNVTAKPKDVLLYGVGIDDFAVTPDADNWSYNVWDRMLDCCYNNYSTRSSATYSDCTIAECWHRYSDFKLWFDKNCIVGYQLDKDILAPGNRVYAPDKCCFVPSYINMTVRWWRQAPKSGYPGVKIFGSGYQAEITHKKSLKIGDWKLNALEAHCDWQRLKANSIDDFLQDYLTEAAPNLRIVKALIKYADRLRSNADAMIPTFRYQH
ncbi:hypothetical protein YA0637_07205 [Pseudomonas syringae]|uniref:hypothetical protein n=1 Tax=Pseudomonas syringae TaxID=317 RepID=UPI0018E65C26|nr:hypothetical protein [Pseudomonas syringae]MBI6671332.1 hypothetical protein [Pseudomonas syringae]QQQ52051.1 hypothetical protein JJQ97_07455 [Pseudomonas syringae]